MTHSLVITFKKKQINKEDESFPQYEMKDSFTIAAFLAVRNYVEWNLSIGAFFFLILISNAGFKVRGCFEEVTG